MILKTWRFLIPELQKPMQFRPGVNFVWIVGSDKMTDAEAENLSYDIAKKIQDEMTYPGQVKITVIRETRRQ